MLHTRRSGSEGFTLIELLIAMVILGIILTPLLSSFVLGLATSAASNATTANSSDADNLAAFFSSDVASAETASLATGCGTSGGGTEVLLLDLGTGATPRFVSYVAASDAAGAAQQGYSQLYTLTRVTCDATNTTLGSADVALTMSQLPTLTCSPSSCTSAASKPISIVLDVTEWGAKSTDDKYTFRVSGARRVTA